MTKNSPPSHQLYEKNTFFPPHPQIFSKDSFSPLPTPLENPPHVPIVVLPAPVGQLVVCRSLAGISATTAGVEVVLVVRAIADARGGGGGCSLLGRHVRRGPPVGRGHRRLAPGLAPAHDDGRRRHVLVDVLVFT